MSTTSGSSRKMPFFLTDDALTEEIIAFLVKCGAHVVPHSDRSLLDHLVAVSRIAARWTPMHEVRIAALLHSYYSHLCESTTRGPLRALVGNKVEEVVWCFSFYNQRAAWDSGTRGILLPPKKRFTQHHHALPRYSAQKPLLEALWTIDLANFLEQLPFIQIGESELQAEVDSFFYAASFLPNAAMDDLNKLFPGRV